MWSFHLDLFFGIGRTEKSVNPGSLAACKLSDKAVPVRLIVVVECVFLPRYGLFVEGLSIPSAPLPQAEQPVADTG